MRGMADTVTVHPVFSYREPDEVRMAAASAGAAEERSFLRVSSMS